MVPNTGGGKLKFFGEVTSELKKDINDKFETLLSFYADVFNENEKVPAVGKIIVKPEAIAKSYKPSALCKNCPIIGGEDLNEIYIKVDRKKIQDTIKLVNNPPSEKFKANMTVVADIQPITPKEKIAFSLRSILQENFDYQKNFGDEFDNAQIWNYVIRKLNLLNLENKYEIVSYGKNLKFLKIEINSQDDIINLASINGIKNIDFFQEYSISQNTFPITELQTLLDSEYKESDVRIGIIDGGISNNNLFLLHRLFSMETF